MKLSACMIVKNEERNIAKCIESYSDVVSEIIVVDTGSTDKTVELAKSLGAKVYDYKWSNHFAAAKNYAIDHAKGDWIIFLDADEYFANNTALNILALIKRLHPSFDTIACKMKNIDYVDGKMLDDITSVRIFRRDKNIRYTNSIHEMLLNTSKNKRLHAFLADENELIIHHTGYSLHNRAEKAKRNLALLLQELDKAQDNPTIYHYISDCYFGIEDWERAIEYARLFIASGARFVGYNVKPHQNIIDSMLRLNYHANDILEEIRFAINKFPGNPSFRFYQANMLFSLKKYDAAYNEYLMTLKLQNQYDDIEINSMPPNHHYVYYRMGIISSHRRDYVDALSNFVESLKLEKNKADYLRRLLMIIKEYPIEDIILLVNSLYDIDSKDDLDFLVTTLKELSLPKVLAYYSALKIKKYGSDELTVIFMLLANKRYDKTFAVAQRCLDEESNNKTFEAIAVISALISQRGEYLDWVVEHATEPMQRFVKALVKNKVMVFSQEDKQEYLNLITYLYLFGTTELLSRAVQLAHYFNEKIIYAELANFFLKVECYAEALKLYQFYIDLSEIKKEEMVNQIFAEGICWFNLRDYEKAITSFIKAYELGYRRNDIFEFLRWCMDKIPENGNIIKIHPEIREIVHYFSF